MKRLALLIVLAAVLSFAGKAAADPPIAVTCGDTIDAPGQYRLADDCGPAGISITASNVHFSLDGHTMTGAGCGISVCTTLSGVTAGNVSDVVIEGPGTITRYPGAGVEFDTVTNSQVLRVTGSGNVFWGIAAFASDGNQIVNNVTDNNGDVNFPGAGDGIELGSGGSGNRIIGNESNANGDVGIRIGAGSTASEVHGNVALSNTTTDLIDEAPDCDDNNWNGNRFGTANPSCIH